MKLDGHKNRTLSFAFSSKSRQTLFQCSSQPDGALCSSHSWATPQHLINSRMRPYLLHILHNNCWPPKMSYSSSGGELRSSDCLDSITLADSCYDPIRASWRAPGACKAVMHVARGTAIPTHTFALMLLFAIPTVSKPERASGKVSRTQCSQAGRL